MKCANFTCIYFDICGIFCTFAAKIMETERNFNTRAFIRRIIYMTVAIVASAMLFTRPVFKFQEDKGIIYIRSFSMDEKVFEVTQTEIETNITKVVNTVSVKGLYFCNIAMLCGSILCFLCFFSRRWRMRIAIGTAVAAGVYYAFMAYYALMMVDSHYATLYPSFMAILPAIVMQMMVMTRHNIISCMDEEDEMPD